ncbi:MAG: 4Fe-4S dicluster domain-containing protein [Anaerolineae bacterium]|nr:4Fe-4S dicluster domain-containing protein [Anaerolineae bacterium]
MSRRIDTSLLPEMVKYGASDIDACFNCGSCTAICPLADNDAIFPRRLIRYAQLGMKDRLAASKDVWMCYYCGECSATCPRAAEPGEFMAAARRFAIAQYDVTGLAKLLYKSDWFNVLFTIFLTVLFSLFMISFERPAPHAQLALFTFIPEIYIRTIALTVAGIAALIGMVGLVRMIRGILREGNLSFTPGGHQRLNWPTALWNTLVVEVLGQTRYRDDECEEEQATPWPVRKWFTHATILYGFLGLFGATALDFLFKPVGSYVPLYYPMRLLGTISGILLMYGTAAALIKRLQKRDKATTYSHASDWILLILLWLAGLTGFGLELADYALLPVTWGYTMLVIHVSLVLDLFALLPISKFAHIVYRAVALFLYNLRPVEQTEESGLAPAKV